MAEGARLESQPADRLKCNCVCGAANHSVGLTKDVENTIALRGDSYWREKHKKIKFTDLQLFLNLKTPLKRPQ